MYTRKLLSRKFFHHEISIKYFIFEFIDLHFSIIDILLNRYSQQSRNLSVSKFQQLRTYSLSSSVLTRSNNNSSTTRNIGQSSKGNGNDGSGKITFHCPKCGDICTHIQSLVCM
jgi:hypothetical protein